MDYKNEDKRLININSYLNSMRFHNYRNLEEFCNENIPPVTMGEILIFIMERTKELYVKRSYKRN